MKINLENQKIYTLLFGKQILTIISKNPFGFIEVEFKIPETKSSSELITIQEQLTINFEEQHSILNKTIDEFNEIVFQSIMLEKRILRISIDTLNEQTK
jgi:hypothetical protein